MKNCPKSNIKNFSSMSGLLFGLLSLVFQNHQLVQDSLKKNQTSTALSIGSCLTFLIYGVFVNSCKSKFQCAENHAYIAFLPVSYQHFFTFFQGKLKTIGSALFCFSKSKQITCFLKAFVSKKAKCKQKKNISWMVDLNFGGLIINNK